MSADLSATVEQFMQGVMSRNPGEAEFHQAVREVVESVLPVVQATPRYRDGRILERIVELSVVPHQFPVASTKD